MKRLKLLMLTFFFLALTASAQETFDYRNPDFSKSQKVEEFGALQFSDIMARMDATAVFLQNNPALKIYVLGYRGKNDTEGRIRRNFIFIKNYLVRSRGIDPERIILTDQGESEIGFSFQIWLAPEGQAPKFRIPLSNFPEDKSVARKFDEYYYAYDDLEYQYWDEDGFSAYVSRINKEPNSIAYVILYPEYSSYGNENGKPTIRRDSLRKINLIKANIIKKLTKEHKLPLSRLKLVNGGYRDNRFVELWLLPKGVEPPAATPNAFPRVIRKKRR